jgi:TldD protein
LALSLFDNSDTTQTQATDLVAQALQGADDGELFVEKRETQGFSFDDGKLKAASFDESQGFGLRSVSGETAAYAHSTEISTAALKRAAALCNHGDVRRATAASPERTNQKLYSAHNPVEAIGFAEKISLCKS